MTNMQIILQKLQTQKLLIDSEIISTLVKDHAPVRAALLKKYNSYKASGLEISNRTASDINKVNNKLINDYRGEIVDQLTGYLFGNPVFYSLSGELYPSTNDPKYLKDIQVIKDFKRLNKIDELDAETGKFMSICGRAARLLYIDKAGKERAMHVDPWECIFIYDMSLDAVQYALRYYDVYDIVDGKTEVFTRVEWYDSKNVYYYLSNATGIFLPDTVTVQIGTDFKPVTQQPHFFDGVPLLDFQNNKELLGDFEKVESLIDGYDRLVSDSQNEIEEFRLAYLIFKGVTPDKDVIAAARETGAFGIGEKDTVEYLTKQINDGFVENHKKTLRENIYRFSKTVDVNADTFTGSGASGEARKWLLLALENRGAKTALKFISSVQQMFRILATSWKKKSIQLDSEAIEIQLDRNLPVELKLEAEIQSLLKGMVSDRTRLKLFSAVKDVDEELTRIEEENELKVDLDAVPGEEEELDEEGNPIKSEEGSNAPAFMRANKKEAE